MSTVSRHQPQTGAETFRLLVDWATANNIHTAIAALVLIQTMIIVNLAFLLFAH